MKKEFNFFEKSGAEEKIQEGDNETEPLQIDEKTGQVMTPEEVEEEKRRRQENPDWWREQQ